MNYEKMQWVILLAVLIPSMVMDLKDRRVCSWLIVSGLVCGLIYNLCTNDNTKNTTIIDMPLIWEYFLRSFPGLALLITAYLAKGCIGSGDGIMTIFIGCVVGFKCTLLVLFIAFSSAAAVGGILVLTKKVGRRYEIPFVPFLALGVIACGIV